MLQRGEFGLAREANPLPQGGWLASSFSNGLSLWPLARNYPIVIDRYKEALARLVFDPQGRWLAVGSINGRGTVRLWDLRDTDSPAGRILREGGAFVYGIAVSPDGEQLLIGTHNDGARLVPLDGNPERRFPGDESWASSVSFSPTGKFGAAIALSSREGKLFFFCRVWDLTSNTVVRTIELEEATAVHPHVRFLDEGHIITSGPGGLLKWNLETGDFEVLSEGHTQRIAIGPKHSWVLFSQKVGEFRGPHVYPGEALTLDLVSGATQRLLSHGHRVTALAIDNDETILVTGDQDGVIRVGPINGDAPHLLLGSTGEIWNLAIDPKGRWIASSSGNELRLWPMPDLSRPPLHTLPRAELIAKLKTLTNLRVIRDPEPATGWKLTHDPFPGWETVPTW